MEQQDVLKQELLAREKNYWTAIMEKDSQVAVAPNAPGVLPPI